MADQLKPITVHGKGGPNPPKVAMLLEELNLPYEFSDVDFPTVKSPEFLAINPNGRMPAIQDPNTNLTLWESGAIVEYLVETYDKKRTISFEPGSNDAQLARQWLFFQVSGQGPYYGQAVWFFKYHKEKVESAIERYLGEIKRVTGVLEGHLKKQKEKAGDEGDGPWLVGNKFSYADLSFAPWQVIGPMVLGELVDLSEFTEVKEWIEKISKRSAVKKILDEQVFVKH